MSEEQPQQDNAMRPTGKRQMAGVSTTTTESYQARQAVAASDSKVKASRRVISFLPEVVVEMRKVIWPTFKQMWNYTIIVFAFLIFLTALVAGIDFLAGLGVEKVLTPR